MNRFKVLPVLFLLLCVPAHALQIQSPVIRDHADLDGLTTGDDHTQYQKESEKDGANGYAGLDGSGDIAVGALPNHASNHTDGTDDIQDGTAAQKGLVTATQITKLDGIEPSAKDDQTDAEIKTAYEANPNTNEFSDAEQTKLGGAEETSNKNIANGYAGLDVSSKLDGAQQVYGTGSNTAAEGNDSRLSDARVPTAHDLAGAEHNADTLADLNTKVSDATLIDTGDSRLSDARTPTTHDLAGAEHAADTLADLNSKVSDATLIDTGDTRIPIQGENDALVGSAGTPSTSNPYLTDEDNRIDIHWDLKTAGEGSFEVFAGTPGIKSPDWDSGDLMGYILVTGSAVDDQGGVVYEFVIPEGVTDLTEVSCTGKLGVASQDAITVRVKREDGTQVDTGGPHQITAAVETLLVINTFSGETFVPGTRFIIEVEYQGDNTETGSIGSCLVEMAR